MKKKWDIEPLLMEVCARFGRKITAASECEELSKHIFSSIHIQISAQTLRRIFGFINDNVISSTNTVSTLLLYCGYASMEELLSHTSSQSNSILDKDKIRFFKEFYNIELSSGVDFNYQKACGNIARQLLQEPDLLNGMTGFLSRSTVAQIFFFERHPYIDGLCNGYSKMIRLYAQEKKTPKAQLFSTCLLHLGSILADDKVEAAIHLNRIKQIPLVDPLHPFIQARRIMAFLTQAWLDKNGEELNRWTDIAFMEERKQARYPSKEAYFPFFQFILADAFNLIGDHESAKEMIQIAEKDYKRYSDAVIENGYFDCLDLVKAIAFYHTGDHRGGKHILNQIENSGFIFIVHDYFLIQRKLLEVESCSEESILKRPRIIYDISQLIKKTGFNIFKRKLS